MNVHAIWRVQASVSEPPCSFLRPSYSNGTAEGKGIHSICRLRHSEKCQSLHPAGGHPAAAHRRAKGEDLSECNPEMFFVAVHIRVLCMHFYCVKLACMTLWVFPD